MKLSAHFNIENSLPAWEWFVCLLTTVQLAGADTPQLPWPRLRGTCSWPKGLDLWTSRLARLDRRLVCRFAATIGLLPKPRWELAS